MTNQEILFSYGKYLYDNNPTDIQIGYEGKNIITGANIQEKEEYIDVTFSNTDQETLDTIGNRIVLKNAYIIVTLKYNKLTLFDSREVNLQKFIEGYTDKSGIVPIYENDESNYITIDNGKRLRIQYEKVKSPITIYNDTDTKTMFWMVPVSHSNH